AKREACRRRKCTHAQLLETAIASAVAAIAILQRCFVDRQDKRRAHAHGKLRLERTAGQAFRSRLRPKDRQPLVFKTNARGRAPTRHQQSAIPHLSRDQKINCRAAIFAARSKRRPKWPPYNYSCRQ